MIKRLTRAKTIARQRAAEHDCIYYVVHFDSGDASDEEGYMVMDDNGLDEWHVGDNEIVFATA